MNRVEPEFKVVMVVFAMLFLAPFVAVACEQIQKGQREREAHEERMEMIRHGLPLDGGR